MQRRPTILFRKDGYNEDEYVRALRHFRPSPVVAYRTSCQNALVFGRYSVLPFYRELDEELHLQGSCLINSYNQHRWVADFGWYETLRDFTFPSWTQDEFPRTNYPGPFVVKGRTNSRKHWWNTHMYAADRAAAVRVAVRLGEDELVSQQGLVFRAYEPLRALEVGLNGLPFANEWRVFYLGEQRLCHGYYWTEAETPYGEIDPAALSFADEVAARAAEHVNFFVLDVAEKEAGGWVLVEVNDAQMSGLSFCKADELYSNLSRASLSWV